MYLNDVECNRLIRTNEQKRAKKKEEEAADEHKWI